MTVASLTLLKGAKQSAVDTELGKSLPPPIGQSPNFPGTVLTNGDLQAPAETEEVIDVDKLNGAQLDKLVKDNEVEVPTNWSKMKVAEKRAWLKTQFEEAVEEPDTEPEVKTIEQIANATGGLPVAEPEAPLVAEEIDTTEVVPAPPKKAKVSKSKAVAIAGKDGEIVDPDVLVDLVQEIENMKEKDAKSLVGTLVEQTEVTFFKQGGVLSVIMANKWFDPYASFKDYVEKEHGMHYRRAMYWIEIYNDLVAAGVPWEKVKSIGWSKLKEIAGVLNNDNVDEWVDIATKQNTISLIETVKAYKAKDAPAAIEDQTAKTVTAKTFKVHEDQKVTIETAIAKAKEMSSTTADTVALEYICLDFLGGPSLVQKLQQMGIEAALNALEKAYPNAKIDVEITETEAAA